MLEMGWLHSPARMQVAASFIHLRAYETVLDPVCSLLLEKKNDIYSIYYVILFFTIILILYLFIHTP